MTFPCLVFCCLFPIKRCTEGFLSGGAVTLGILASVWGVDTVPVLWCVGPVCGFVALGLRFLDVTLPSYCSVAKIGINGRISCTIYRILYVFILYVAIVMQTIALADQLHLHNKPDDEGGGVTVSVTTNWGLSVASIVLYGVALGISFQPSSVAPGNSGSSSVSNGQNDPFATDTLSLQGDPSRLGNNDGNNPCSDVRDNIPENDPVANHCNDNCVVSNDDEDDDNKRVFPENDVEQGVGTTNENSIVGGGDVEQGVGTTNENSIVGGGNDNNTNINNPDTREQQGCVSSTNKALEVASLIVGIICPIVLATVAVIDKLQHDPE